MKFTIKYEVFLDMLKQAGKKLTYQKLANRNVKIATFESKVFVEANSYAIWIEAQVEGHGQCQLPLKPFVEVIKTFKGKDELVIQIDERELSIENFSMSITDCALSDKVRQALLNTGVKYNKG